MRSSGLPAAALTGDLLPGVGKRRECTGGAPPAQLSQHASFQLTYAILLDCGAVLR